jgi:sugar O-acyltransferase (sialic acid O-acetyltransferase NeuD family)
MLVSYPLRWRGQTQKFEAGMTELYVYCAGGFGKEVMDVARRLNALRRRWSAIHFLDDVCVESSRYGAKVVRFDDLLSDGLWRQGEVVIANGEPAVRDKLARRLAAVQATLGVVVDVSTLVADSAHLAPGAVVTPLCSISSDARLERNAAVNTMSIVGHDVVVGENTVISSMVNIGGASKIGKNSYIGMGALIKESVVIGDDVIIGMGSVVYADIPDGVIALGNPARPMRPNTDKKVFR